MNESMALLSQCPTENGLLVLEREREKEKSNVDGHLSSTYVNVIERVLNDPLLGCFDTIPVHCQLK